MNMIFLSAQPDDYYFLWQLKLQLYNFNMQAIPSENIHVLIGYDSEKGLQQSFLTLMEEYPEVKIYTYTDTRTSKIYASSIRPHIISKHLTAFPELQEAAIFYHDSDIVFKGLPDFSLLNQGDSWYTSDTRSYLDCSYIKNTVGRDIFEQMCSIVGVTTAAVEANDANAGGAQYLLKRTSPEFWQKVEADCEKMYGLLTDCNDRQGFCSNKVLIQAWCADMWVVWWNTIYYDKEFHIHPELQFAWANSPATRLDECKILHYTGSKEKGNPKFFRKFDYVHYSPFYTDLSEIDPNLCSAYLKDLIDDYLNLQNLKRTDLSDVSFLLIARIDSIDRLQNIYTSIWNLSIHFDTNILLTEVDDVPRIDSTKLPQEVQYIFIKDSQPKFHQTKYINHMILKARTPFISIYDADAILPVNQISASAAALRSGRYSAVSPYSGNFLNVDRLLKAIFIKLQDASFLEENSNKLTIASRRSVGGAIFLNRVHYLEAGLENENLLFWGPNDVERIKRLSVLGYKVKRITGNLYHLAHARGINSGYQSLDEQYMLMEEYLKICNMEKNELQAYIGTWHWKPQLIK